MEWQSDSDVSDIDSISSELDKEEEEAIAAVKAQIRLKLGTYIRFEEI